MGVGATSARVHRSSEGCSGLACISHGDDTSPGTGALGVAGQGGGRADLRPGRAGRPVAGQDRLTGLGARIPSRPAGGRIDRRVVQGHAVAERRHVGRVWCRTRRPPRRPRIPGAGGAERRRRGADEHRSIAPVHTRSGNAVLPLAQRQCTSRAVDGRAAGRGTSEPWARVVAVGVHAHAKPDRLVQTVWSLRDGGAGDATVVLLPDGPDDELAAAPATDPALASLPQWETAEPLGAPACFNRLASGTDTAVVILIQSGTLLGPGCLSLLVQALDRPGQGLAGPSTNRSWNEQAVFGAAGPPDIARTAAQARRRFGSAARFLEPLHSLADFCLAVRREVIEAIGGADEKTASGRAGRWTIASGPPGRLSRRVDGRRVCLPIPAHRAAARRRGPADGPVPAAVPGPFLRSSAEPAPGRLRGPLPGRGL